MNNVILPKRLLPAFNAMITKPKLGGYTPRELVSVKYTLLTLIPELKSGLGMRQGPHHIHDVFNHTISTMVKTPPKLHLRLAALFHDIGKPLTETGQYSDIHFLGHEKVGAEMTKKIMTRLGYSPKLTDKVSHLVKHHLIGYSPSWSNRAVNRFERRVGRENIRDLFILNRADSLAKTEEIDRYRLMRQELGARLGI